MIVDHFLSMGSSLLLLTYARLKLLLSYFLKNIVEYFGIVQDIISDHDTMFAGQFWIALFNMSGTKLNFIISAGATFAFNINNSRFR